MLGFCLLGILRAGRSCLGRRCKSRHGGLCLLSDFAAIDHMFLVDDIGHICGVAEKVKVLA